MLQTNLAEMEGGGEIIVADRPDTLRATTLALAQRGQLHSYAKNSQTIAQDRRFHVFVTERTDIVVLALEKTIEAQSEKIKEMKIFIDDMEAELKLLEIEKDIAAINAAINGEESSSEFGKVIGKYKKAQKEFYASQGEVESSSKEVKGPSADDFMGTDSGSTSGSTSDSYWK